MSDERIGKLVEGRFRLEEHVGGGASGNVYRARDLSADEIVAVKIFSQSIAAGSQFVEAFLRECRLLHQLRHPNSVRYIQHGLFEDKYPYVALEFVSGRSLDEIMREHGPMPARKVAEYLDAIGSVLDAAHDLDVVHRDIKPANLVLNFDPKGKSLVKVIDFGVASCLGVDAAVSSLVQPAGTPAYMAPEVCEGRKIDRLADVYSLGVTLYQLLTGALPFQEKSVLAMAEAHLEKPVPPFSERNPRCFVLPAAEEVVHQAMAKEPAKRPQSAGELARLFREALYTRPPPRPRAEPAAAAEPAAPGPLPMPELPRFRLDPPVAAAAAAESKPASDSVNDPLENERLRRQLREANERNASLEATLAQLHDRLNGPAGQPGDTDRLSERETELLALRDQLETEQRRLAEKEEQFRREVRETELRLSRQRAELASGKAELEAMRLEFDLDRRRARAERPTTLAPDDESTVF